MTQDEFKRRHRESWQRLEAMLRHLARKRERRMVSAREPVDLAEFDREYRRVCKHLALARQRLYSSDLVAYLNDLALRSHQRFYTQRRRYFPAVARFFLGEFPALVRAHAGAVLLAAALFVVPAGLTVLALRADPDLVHAMMDAEQIRMFEEMYEPGSAYRSREREAASDMTMFGYYVGHNIGIGFRVYAAGIALGIGSIVFLAVNGVVLGAVASHLVGQLGYGSTFFPFVAGHSAPELVAIVLAGAAGIALGFSVIAPGRRARLESLRLAARRGVALVAGAASMLVLAACIEAFWSARTSVPDEVKLAVGALVWVATLAYFLFVGRRHDAG